MIPKVPTKFTDRDNFLKQVTPWLDNVTRDWEDRGKVMELIRQQIESESSDDIGVDLSDESFWGPIMPAFHQLLITQINDLRSQSVAKACNLTTAFAQQFGSMFAPFVASMLPAVWAQCMVRVKAISVPVNVMVAEIVRNSLPRKLVQQLPGLIKSTKSAALRFTQANIVFEILNNWGVDDLHGLSKPLVAAVRQLVGDSGSDTRAIARHSYWLLAKTFPRPAEQMLAALDARTRNNISDDEHKEYASKLVPLQQAVAPQRSRPATAKRSASATATAGPSSKRPATAATSTTGLSGAPVRSMGAPARPARRTASANGPRSLVSTTTTSRPTVRDPFANAPSTQRSTMKTPSKSKATSGDNARKPMAVKRSPSAPAAPEAHAASTSTAMSKTPGRLGQASRGTTPRSVNPRRTPLGSASRAVRGRLGGTPAQRVIRGPDSARKSAKPDTNKESSSTIASSKPDRGTRLDFGGSVDDTPAEEGSSSRVHKDSEDLLELIQDLLTTKTDWQKRKEQLGKLSAMLVKVSLEDEETVSFVLGPKMRTLLRLQLSDKRPGMVKAAKEFAATIIDHFTVGRTRTIPALDSLGTYIVPKLVRVVSEAATRTLASIVQSVNVNFLSACAVDDAVIESLWGQFKASKGTPRWTELADALSTAFAAGHVLARSDKFYPTAATFLRVTLSKTPVLGCRTEEAFWTVYRYCPTECEALLAKVSSATRDALDLAKPAEEVAAVTEEEVVVSEVTETAPVPDVTEVAEEPVAVAAVEEPVPVAVAAVEEPVPVAVDRAPIPEAVLECVAEPVVEEEKVVVVAEPKPVAAEVVEAPVVAEVAAPVEVVEAPVVEPVATPEPVPAVVEPVATPEPVPAVAEPVATPEPVPAVAEPVPSPTPSPAQVKVAPIVEETAAASPATPNPVVTETSTSSASVVVSEDIPSDDSVDVVADEIVPDSCSEAEDEDVATVELWRELVDLGKSITDLWNIGCDVDGDVRMRVAALTALFNVLQDRSEAISDDECAKITNLFYDVRSAVRFAARTMFWLYTEQHPDQGYSRLQDCTPAQQSILRNEHARMLSAHGRVVMPSA